MPSQSFQNSQTLRQFFYPLYRQEKEVLITYGMFMQSSEGADPRIAPLTQTMPCV